MLHVGVCCAVVFVPCSLVVTCLKRADLLAVMFVVFCHFLKYVLVHIIIKDAVKLVRALQCNILLTVPRRSFFFGSFMFVSVLCLYVLCGHLLGKG